ncbi:hypothetical protein A3753_26885 [Sulfitobacter sp. HI0082]|nr:hypothetical protein A3753_26885 [Sulfitobacter sp. HI0082]
MEALSISAHINWFAWTVHSDLNTELICEWFAIEDGLLNNFADLDTGQIDRKMTGCQLLEVQQIFYHLA